MFAITSEDIDTILTRGSIAAKGGGFGGIGGAISGAINTVIGSAQDAVSQAFPVP
jgi:hypothetical protein